MVRSYMLATLYFLLKDIAQNFPTPLSGDLFFDNAKAQDVFIRM